VVASRRHGGERLAAALEVLEREHGAVELRNVGSALKLCLLAEGEADLYPRLAPTSEWDTAAADAVLEAAGGAVLQLGGARLAYNKSDILNPEFVAVADPAFDWLRVFNATPARAE
jgi:3'(2'), 5'-bisphosphate nucleotidase